MVSMMAEPLGDSATLPARLHLLIIMNFTMASTGFAIAVPKAIKNIKYLLYVVQN